MNARHLLRHTAFVAFALASASVASAQVSDSQVFAMSAPTNISITAPTGTVAAVHDETDGNQVFLPQQWQVESNAKNGVTVTFSTNQPFTNTADSSYQRDALLLLAKSAGGPSWTVTVASDQTNYAGIPADGVATVQAVSTKAGGATLDLTVTFLTVDWDTLAGGDYELSVTGTITAN